MSGSRVWRLFMLFAVCALAATALLGCASEQPTAVEPASQEIEEQSQQDQAVVDDALNSAQAAVAEFVSVGDGLETRVTGLQLRSDLQEIQRKLTNAIEQTGDAKIGALEELSSAFTDLIDRVETAAGKAPAGGEIQTELNAFAQQLKDVQASLAQAAAEYDPASTTTP